MKSYFIILFFSVYPVFPQDSVKVYHLINQSNTVLKKSDSKSALKFAHQALAISTKNKFIKGVVLSNNQLGYVFESQSNYDSVNYYVNKNISIAQNPNLKNELAFAYNLSGLALMHKSQYKLALQQHKKSLSIYLSTKNQKGLADTYAKTGNVYYDLSDFPIALENLLQSVKIYTNLNDSNGIADVCCYLGKVYTRLNEKESAKKYLLKALSISKIIQNNRGIAITYNGLGNLFMENHDLMKALNFFKKTKKFHTLGGDQIGVSIAQINIATIYYMMSSLSDGSLTIIGRTINYNSLNPIRKSILDSAELYFKGSMIINSKVGNQFGLVYGYNGIGDVYVKEKHYTKAISEFKKAYLITKNLNAVSEQYESALRLSNCFELLNNKDSAYFYLKTYTHLKEEVIGEERQRELFKKESEYEYDKKLQKEKIIKEAREAIVVEKEKRQYLIILGIAIVLIIVIYFAVILNKRLKIARGQKQLIEQQKASLEQKNKEIIDSITYAKRIQDAMLTSNKYINNEIKKLNAESFIVFKPKDIVSGDFYWFHTYNNILYYMTADSTGHGVPGGFMSMLGINALSEIIIERKIYDTGEILNRLRDKIINSLKTDDGFSKDGMDAVICKLDNEKKILEFSSANNSLYIVRQGKLIEYKSQKMPVGYMEGAISFTTNKVLLQKEDMIYTFTDGFADQFGGPKGKKFMSKKFKEVLLANSHLPLSKQKEVLETTFKNWVGDLEQVDDVCIVGIRI